MSYLKMIRDKISKLKAILSAISDVSAWPRMRKQFNYTIGAGYERIYFFHILAFPSDYIK